MVIFISYFILVRCRGILFRESLDYIYKNCYIMIFILYIYRKYKRINKNIM